MGPAPTLGPLHPEIGMRRSILSLVLVGLTSTCTWAQTSPKAIDPKPDDLRQTKAPKAAPGGDPAAKPTLAKR